MYRTEMVALRVESARCSLRCYVAIAIAFETIRELHSSDLYACSVSGYSNMNFLFKSEVMAGGVSFENNYQFHLICMACRNLT